MARSSLLRNGKDIAADASEMPANIAITVIGLVILFFIFNMLVLLCLAFLIDGLFMFCEVVIVERVLLYL